MYNFHCTCTCIYSFVLQICTGVFQMPVVEADDDADIDDDPVNEEGEYH